MINKVTTVMMCTQVSVLWLSGVLGANHNRLRALLEKSSSNPSNKGSQLPFSTCWPGTQRESVLAGLRGWLTKALPSDGAISNQLCGHCRSTKKIQFMKRDTHELKQSKTSNTINTINTLNNRLKPTQISMSPMQSRKLRCSRTLRNPTEKP